MTKGHKEDSTIFPLGVAYYPDYIYGGRVIRTMGGDIKSLSVSDHMKEDFERMKSLGITWIRMGEFSWAHVEPKRGEVNTERFESALNLATEYGIDVIFCTPTATPPKWLVDENSDILAMWRDQKQVNFGGRRHYDPSSPVYLKEARRISSIYAKTFGSHPAVKGWQIDNEMGNEGSAFLYSKNALKLFREFLKEKYDGDIARLNKEWFTCFWSQAYNDFSEIILPWSTYSDTNPHLDLDYRRFNTKVWQDFQRVQMDEIKKHSKGRFILTNYPPVLFDLDLWKISEELDYVAYDHYQMGPKADPVSSTTQFNFLRSLKQGEKFMILEQQPVQVNWQKINTRHELDWLFIWGAQSAFLGSSTLHYFSWRRFPGGCEQFHDAVVPHDARNPESQQEKIVKATNSFFGKISKEFSLKELPEVNSKVLMVTSIESFWSHDIASQSAAYKGIEEVDRVQKIFAAKGLATDFCENILKAPKDLSEYKLIVFPGYAFEFSDEELKILEKYLNSGGKCLSFPRTGFKTRYNQMSSLPLKLFKQDDFYFEDFGAMLPEENEAFKTLSGESFNFNGRLWAEKIIINSPEWKSLAEFSGGLFDSYPAVMQNSSFKNGGSYTHVAVCPEVNSDFSNWLLAALNIDSKIALMGEAAVQFYPLKLDGREFIACINFEKTDCEVELKYSIKSWAEANLDKSLALEFQTNTPLKGGRVVLAPRSVHFMEV